MCLENISKDFAVDIMKKTGTKWICVWFLFDYESVDADDILDIHKYLMKKNNIKQCLDLLKSVFWIIRHLHRKFWWVTSL